MAYNAMIEHSDGGHGGHAMDAMSMESTDMDVLVGGTDKDHAEPMIFVDAHGNEFFLWPKKDEEEDGYDEVDLPSSVYGAAVFGLAYDLTEILTPDSHDQYPLALHLFRLFYLLFMLLINYGLQAFLLIWSNEFVVTPAVHGIQALYRTFHAEAFDEDGTFLEENWLNEALFPALLKRKLCQIPLSHWRFTFAIIWLWSMVMIAELRETLQTMGSIQRVEGTWKLDDVIHVPHAGGRSHLRRLTPWLRYTIQLAVTIPKLILNLSLFIFGIRWLVATPDFSGLILNVLALGFIIEVDEIIFHTFLPKKMRETVEHTKFLLPEESLEQDIHDRWSAYRWSAFWFTLSISVCFSYIFLAQLVDPSQVPLTVLPGYQFDLRDICHPVVDEMSENLCRNLPDPMNCFPFGIGSGVDEFGDPAIAHGSTINGGKKR
jgi:hypothetical protein